MSLLVFSFWFSPLCESPLRAISTWVYCFTLFCLLPCVRVRRRLYPHGLTVLLFWFAPMCESPLRTVSTWTYCFTLFSLLPCVRIRCGLYPHGLTVSYTLGFLPCVSLLRTVSTFLSLNLSHLCFHQGKRLDMTRALMMTWTGGCTIENNLEVQRFSSNSQ